MKKLLLVSILLTLGATLTVSAQMKIGYANMEGIMFYMPETKSMEATLTKYSEELAAPLKVKDDYFKLKYQEYQELAQAQATAEQLGPIEQELQKLQQDLQKAQQGAESKLMQKERELQQPMLDRLQKAIKEVAEEGGYTYILNSTASGASILIHGPDSGNVTKQIMDKLGIKIPEGGNN
jgi:outer membrane protein